MKGLSRGLSCVYQEETLGSYEVPRLAPVCPGPSRKDIFLLAADEAEEVMVTFGSSFLFSKTFKKPKADYVYKMVSNSDGSNGLKHFLTNSNRLKVKSMPGVCRGSCAWRP